MDELLNTPLQPLPYSPLMFEFMSEPPMPKTYHFMSGIGKTIEPLTVIEPLTFTEPSVTSIILAKWLKLVDEALYGNHNFVSMPDVVIVRLLHRLGRYSDDDNYWVNIPEHLIRKKTHIVDELYELELDCEFAMKQKLDFTPKP